MVFGWRKAFCTSVDQDHRQTANPTPRIRPKFGFLSNPSTPRLRSQSVSTNGLSCRSSAVATTPSSSLPNSPKLHCRTKGNATTRNNISTSPKLFSSFSNPSSPKSPSSGLSLLKATFLLNKISSNRCGICLQSVKSGQGSEIFTAECSHAFHLHCIATRGDKRCPVCGGDASSIMGFDPKRRPEPEPKNREIKIGKSLKVYDDDETLTNSPVSLAQFNTIPESDENDDVEDEYEFPGFFANTNTMTFALSSQSTDPLISKNLEVKLQSESAVVAAGRRYETHAVLMKVKAPPHTVVHGARRPSVDLVTVLDLSGGVKLHTVKHAMRLMISLLRETDRLSIVVFSSGSKRLLPLRRMTAEGRRNARRIVDALVGNLNTGAGVGLSVKDAVKKAVKVVEDRRERNPTASIVVLSDGQDNPAVLKAQLSSKRVPFVVSTTRISHLEIPVHSVWVAPSVSLDYGPLRDAFTDRVAGLLNVAIKEVRLQLGLVAGSDSSEIASVYSLTGRPERFGSGSVVVVGDLFGEEERELLVECKVAASSSRSHHVMSVRSTSIDPRTHQPMMCPTERRLLIPRPHTLRSSSPSIYQLRNLYAASRAIADSRRLIEQEDLAAAYHLLYSALAMMSQANAGSVDDGFHLLETELVELNRLRQRTGSVVRIGDKSVLRQRNGSLTQAKEETNEPLTPKSAWRAAEKLSKVAITGKHMNRVSDLHGLEDARF